MKNRLFIGCTAILLLLMVTGCSNSIPTQKVESTADFEENSTDVEIAVKDEDRNKRGFEKDLNIDASNPIDIAFERDFQIASATVELNFLAEKYLEAWKSEWNNIMNELKKLYQFQEDKDKVDSYKKSYEETIRKASELERLDWSDTSVEPGENRIFGTGVTSAALMEEAELYKRQVLYLIDKYYDGRYDILEDEYLFIYKGNGAEIEKKQQYRK